MKPLLEAVQEICAGHGAKLAHDVQVSMHGGDSWTEESLSFEEIVRQCAMTYYRNLWEMIMGLKYVERMDALNAMLKAQGVEVPPPGKVVQYDRCLHNTVSRNNKLTVSGTDRDGYTYVLVDGAYWLGAMKRERAEEIVTMIDMIRHAWRDGS